MIPSEIKIPLKIKLEDRRIIQRASRMWDDEKDDDPELAREGSNYPIGRKLDPLANHS